MFQLEQIQKTHGLRKINSVLTDYSFLQDCGYLNAKLKNKLHPTENDSIKLLKQISL